MTIFITDGSRVGWQRIYNLLKTIPNVHLLGGATDAKTSLDSIRRLKPDVLILDIEFPASVPADYRKGVEHLQDVLREQPSLRVIVLTNAADNYYRKQCLKAGAMFFFDKATEFHKVPKVIQELLDSLNQITTTNKSLKGESL